LPYKTLLGLRDAKLKRLEEEQKHQKELENNQRSMNIQNAILTK